MLQILLVSNNPLFLEVVNAAISKYIDVEIKCIQPTANHNWTILDSTFFMIIDEKIGTDYLREVLEAGHYLSSLHILLLNLESNDYVRVDSRRSALTRTEDLMQEIRKSTSLQSILPSIACPVIEPKTTANMFAFLASILNVPPDTALIRRLRTFRSRGLVDLFINDDNEASVPAGISEIEIYFELTACVSEEQLVKEISIDWARLFRGVRPGYGPPPPYEGLYVPNDDDTVAILQSLANSYQEYSAAMTQSYHNRIDYAGVELDFMRYLCELEDEALQNNQVELAIGYSKAAASFFASHPSRWMGSFCTEALKYAQTGFFHGYLNLVKQITSEETIFVILQNLDKQEGLHE